MGVEGQDPVCEMPGCHLTLANHGERMHSFVTPGQDPGAALKQPSKKDQKTPEPKIMVAPMPDLVLRGLLLRKGLITTEELEAVERELAVGQAPRVYAEPPANT